jgi:hypothetical protein
MYSFMRFSRRRFATALYNYTHPKNPKVFMEIGKNDASIGKLVFELYANHCPKTTENLRPKRTITVHLHKSLKNVTHPYIIDI